MNKIIFPLSIIVAVSVGYCAGKNSHIPDTAPPIAVFAQSEALNPIAIQTSSTLSVAQHQQNDPVTAENQQLSSHPELSISAQPSQQQINEIKAQYEAEQHSEKFTEWLTKNQKDKPWFDLGIEMNGRFSAEEIDYGWASAEEEYLQTLFIQDSALAGIALKSTSCKSTQCQITVSVMDQDHANETAMTISKVIGNHKSAQIIIDNKAKQGEAIFYVSRNEKGFELK